MAGGNYPRKQFTLDSAMKLHTVCLQERALQVTDIWRYEGLKERPVRYPLSADRIENDVQTLSQPLQRDLSCSDRPVLNTADRFEMHNDLLCDRSPAKNHPWVRARRHTRIYLEGEPLK